MTAAVRALRRAASMTRRPATLSRGSTGSGGPVAQGVAHARVEVLVGAGLHVDRVLLAVGVDGVGRLAGAPVLVARAQAGGELVLLRIQARGVDRAAVPLTLIERSPSGAIALIHRCERTPTACSSATKTSSSICAPGRRASISA